MLYITSPSFNAAVALMDALKGHVDNIKVSVIAWGHEPLCDVHPDDRWLVLEPDDLPDDAPFPDADFVSISLRRDLASQVHMAIRELQWTPVATA